MDLVLNVFVVCKQVVDVKMNLSKQVFVSRPAGLSCLPFRLRSVVDKCYSLIKLLVVISSRGCILLYGPF